MAIIEQTGVLKQVDDEGNVVVLYPAVKTDSTLLESGAPADAAAVGEALKNVKPADSSVVLTQVEYDALSDEEKNNGTTYFISDANGECDATQVSFTSSNYTATNVAGALEEVNSSLSENIAFPDYTNIVKSGIVTDWVATEDIYFETLYCGYNNNEGATTDYRVKVNNTYVGSKNT